MSTAALCFDPPLRFLWRTCLFSARLLLVLYLQPTVALDFENASPETM